MLQEGTRNMNTLWVYIDESGDIPLEDEDGPFVVASVSIFGNPPAIADKVGRVDWLVEKIQELQAIPFIVEIVPEAGFGQAIKSKMSKLDTMARATKLVTGNHKYISQYGFVPRNIIWCQCVVQSVANAMVKCINRGSVDKINIVVDEMALADGMRILLKDTIKKRLPMSLSNVLREAAELYVDKVRTFIANSRFEKNIQLEFGRAESKEQTTDGLHLAHYLASLYRKQRAKNHALSIKLQLEKYGHQNFIKNQTNILIEPIASESINTWKRNTGLPEPRK